MRICIVTVASYLYGLGGMQRATADLVNGLTAAGHEVEVITGRHPGGARETSFNGATWHFLDVPTHVKRIRTQHPAWHRATHAEFLRLNAERPFDVVHSESVGALGLMQRGVHPRVAPVVIKFHGNYLGLVKAAARRAQATRTPYAIAREAKHVFDLTAVWLGSRGEPYRFRNCEAIVPSRQQLEDTVKSHMLRRSHVHVVPTGVDTTVFRPRPTSEARQALGLPDAPLLVVVGRLNREKGVGVALDALREIPDAVLVVVGDGEERSELENRAVELGVAARVRFEGAREADDVAVYLSAADVFLFPTERDEAQGLVLFEAMASGTPVVASRIGGIPEVVGDDETGILVPPGDHRALARAVAGLLRDADRRERLAAAGRARVLADFTIERMVSRTVDVYRLAVEDARRRS